MSRSRGDYYICVGLAAWKSDLQLIDDLMNAAEVLCNVCSQFPLETRTNITMDHHDPVIYLNTDMIRTDSWFRVEFKFELLSKFLVTIHRSILFWSQHYA